MRWPVTWRNKCARRWPIPSYLVCTVLLNELLINTKCLVCSSTLTNLYLRLLAFFCSGSICSKLILGTHGCQNTPVCMWSWSYFRCYKDIGACEGTDAPGNRPEIDSYWLHYQGQHREDGQVQGRDHNLWNIVYKLDREMVFFIHNKCVVIVVKKFFF